VLMLEHAIYSVISPEGCASILWRDSAQAPLAAEAMRITAQDLKKLGLIDEIIPEPMGGAHRDPEAALISISDAIALALAPLKTMTPEALRARRREKFLAMGKVGLA
jgi:acetyl-CoA carboxylase carboxyl transferase subunit alpha